LRWVNGFAGGSLADRLDPHCLTIDKLLKNERVTDAFESAWAATSRSGNENGGWIFADANFEESLFLYKASEGLRNSMDKEPEEFAALNRRVRRASRPVRFILDYHTHPNRNPSPGADIWARDTYLKRGSIGVIIYGAGKYTFYNDGRILNPLEYKKCL
jgi:hypothetical protein